MLRDQARGSGGKEASGELRDGVGCAAGIIPCRLPCGSGLFLAVSPQQKLPTLLWGARGTARQPWLSFTKPFGGGFPSVPEETAVLARLPGDASHPPREPGAAV